MENNLIQMSALPGLHERSNFQTAVLHQWLLEYCPLKGYLSRRNTKVNVVKL